MIKYSKLRDKLKVETLNGNAEDLAFFTHYLHNHTNIKFQIRISLHKNGGQKNYLLKLTTLKLQNINGEEFKKFMME